MTLNNLGLPVKPLRDVTDEERDALATDGVVIIRGVLPDEWIEPLRDAVDDLLAHPDYLERGSTPESAAVMGGTMVNGFMGWMLNDVIEALATHSPASEIAKQLLPEQSVQYFYDQMFVKRPGVDSGTPWHRDRNYYSHRWQYRMGSTFCSGHARILFSRMVYAYRCWPVSGR